MQGVILAAGEGSRFGEMTKELPKPLIKVGDRSLIEWVIENMSLVGIEEIIVSVGHMHYKIKDYLGDRFENVKIRYAVNKEWNLGNLTSLLAAKKYIKDDFILSMSDHMFDPSIFNDLSSQKQQYSVILAADMKYQQTEDDMKVLVNKNYFIEDIGKTILGNYVDTGLFKLSPRIFEYAEQCYENGEYQLYKAILRSAKRTDAVVFDIKNRFWIDVDTPEEYNSYYVQKYPVFFKNKKWY